jgi:hypothetical protein
MSDINLRTKLVGGIDENGNIVPLSVSEEGHLNTTGGGGGGSGGGDATASNQVDQLEILENLSAELTSLKSNLFSTTTAIGSITTSVGATGEAQPTNDTEIYTLFQALVRIIQKMPTLEGDRVKVELDSGIAETLGEPPPTPQESIISEVRNIRSALTYDGGLPVNIINKPNDEFSVLGRIEDKIGYSSDNEANYIYDEITPTYQLPSLFGFLKRSLRFFEEVKEKLFNLDNKIPRDSFPISGGLNSVDDELIIPDSGFYNADISSYTYLVLEVSGDFLAELCVSFQVGSEWQETSLMVYNIAPGSVVDSISSPGIYFTPLPSDKVRLKLGSHTIGNVNFNLFFKKRLSSLNDFVLSNVIFYALNSIESKTVNYQYTPIIQTIQTGAINTRSSLVIGGARRLSFKSLTPSANLKYRYNNSDLSTNFYTVNSGVEETEDFGDSRISATLHFSSDVPNTLVAFKYWN